MSGVDVSWLWMTGGAVLIVGIGIGMLIAYWFLPGDNANRKFIRENEELKTSQARYRQDVQAHFAKTGELFEDLTKSYRKVYDHLADGAVNLGAGREDRPELELPDARKLIDAAQGAAVATAVPESPPSEAEAAAAEQKAAATDERESSPADTEEESPAAREPGQTIADTPEAATAANDTDTSKPVPEADGGNAPDALGSEAGRAEAAERPEPLGTSVLATEQEPEERPRALH